MNWIDHPLILRGNHVELAPLDASHIAQLNALAKDQQIWKHYAVDGSDTAKLTASLEYAIIERGNGMQYPFVIMLRADNKVIGSTRFLDIQPQQRKLEIGWTWLHPEHWGTKVNTECKYLLLQCCFEQLLACRVQLKTDENNVRSRKAILKIGARFEGILRNDMIRDNGTHRHSAYYSIIDSEWPAVKEELLERLRA